MGTSGSSSVGFPYGSPTNCDVVDLQSLAADFFFAIAETEGGREPMARSDNKVKAPRPFVQAHMHVRPRARTQTRTRAVRGMPAACPARISLHGPIQAVSNLYAKHPCPVPAPVGGAREAPAPKIL